MSERHKLDRMSAKRMHLPKFVALTAKPDSATLRFKFARLGMKADDKRIKELLELVDNLGAQQMLDRQPVFIRYVAAERRLERKKPFE